jgi:hypothetical protein
MSEMTAGIFFTNLFNATTGAENAGSNPTDVLGTVVGVGQAVQGGVSLIAGNLNALSKPIGYGGGFLSALGLYDNFRSIRSDLAAGKSPAFSDLAGAIGNAASLAGSVLVVVGVGETLAIPIGVVTGLAGTVQLIGSATGYRIDLNGLATKVVLTANEWAQAASQLALANSNTSVIAAALSGAGINPNAANTFLVPQTDANGNVVGFQPETPLSSAKLGEGITQYTFDGGVTFKQQAASYMDPSTGQETIVINPLAAWMVTQSNGSTTTLNLAANGGYSSAIANSLGAVTQQTGLQISSSTQNGITTTTQMFTSNLGGAQSTVQNQITSSGSTASEVTTVYNSEGSVSYTENKASTSGLVTSDVINANVNASLVTQGNNVVLNGAAGDLIDVWGQNDVLMRVAHGSTSRQVDSAAPSPATTTPSTRAQTPSPHSTEPAASSTWFPTPLPYSVSTTRVPRLPSMEPATPWVSGPLATVLRPTATRST